MIFLNVKDVLNLKKKTKILLFVCVILPVLLIFYSFIEPFILVNKNYDLSKPKNEKPVKIVFLTDIHVGPFYSVERLERLVKRVNKLNPDIILLGGDYVHRDKKYIPLTFSVLKELKGAVFIGGVLGNHDHWESKDLSYEEMKKANITILDNADANISVNGRTINVFGVGDYYEDVQKINYDDIRLNKGYNILLSHNPDYIGKLDQNDIDKFDLVLSGHTHGGQVTFFGLWAPLVPSIYGQKFRTGQKTIGKTKIIISNGIGTVTPPVRFFAFPQICIITI